MFLIDVLIFFLILLFVIFLFILTFIVFLLLKFKKTLKIFFFSPFKKDPFSYLRKEKVKIFSYNKKGDDFNDFEVVESKINENSKKDIN